VFSQGKCLKSRRAPKHKTGKEVRISRRIPTLSSGLTRLLDAAISRLVIVDRHDEITCVGAHGLRRPD
jgi:hypothetical protein